MKRTRYVVLPVRSWQYIILLIISLACFTFGIMSRNRERRYRNDIGHELMYTTFYKMEFCSNDDHIYPLSRFLSLTKLTSTVSSAIVISSRNSDSSKLIQSTWISHKSHLNSRHYDKSHLISNQIYRHQLYESMVHIIQMLFTKHRDTDKKQERQVKLLKNSNIHIRRQLKERIVSGQYKSYIEYNIRNSQFDKFIQKYRKEQKSIIYNPRVDTYKFRFVKDLHYLNFKIGLSFINLEFQNRQKIKKTLVHKLRSENELNFLMYPNSKKEYHQYHIDENRYNFRANYKIIIEERQFNSNKNSLVSRKHQIFYVQNRFDSRIINQHKIVNKISNYKIKRQNKNLKSKHKLLSKKYLRNEIKKQWVYKTRFIFRYYIRDEMSRLKDQKLNKHIGTKENIQEISRLKNRLILENNISFKLSSRKIKIKKYNIEYSKNHRDISHLQNNYLLAMNLSYDRNNRSINSILQTSSERNQRKNLFSHRETTRQIYGNRLYITINIVRKLKQKSNKIINIIQLQNGYLKIKKDERYSLILTIQEEERKKQLSLYYDRELVSKKLKNVSIENLQQKTKYGHQKMINFRSQYQINVNKLDEIKNEKHIKRYRSMHIEYVNFKNNLIDFIKIKTASMDPRYLKSITKRIDLDYEILRQTIVIVFCAFYSASILKSKNTLIGNLGKNTDSVSIL